MRLETVWRHGFCWALFWAGAASLFAVTGCGGDGKVARYPVNGSVNVDGKPTAGVNVIFCPTDGSPEVQRLRPSGYTGTDGKFQLITITPNDGAPAGHYKVLIQWPSKPGNPNDPNNGPSGEDRLHSKYMILDQSPFQVEIKSGTNDLPPFEVKTK